MVNPGEELRLTIRISGLPPPHVKWFRNEREVVETETVEVGVQLSLVLKFCFLHILLYVFVNGFSLNCLFCGNRNGRGRVQLFLVLIFFNSYFLLKFEMVSLFFLFGSNLGPNL